jgi:hypothetical protein
VNGLLYNCRGVIIQSVPAHCLENEAQNSALALSKHSCAQQNSQICAERYSACFIKMRKTVIMTPIALKWKPWMLLECSLQTESP